MSSPRQTKAQFEAKLLEATLKVLRANNVTRYKSESLEVEFSERPHFDAAGAPDLSQPTKSQKELDDEALYHSGR